MTPTVLLTSPLAPPGPRAALARALASVGASSAPTWRLDPRAADVLEDPVRTVLAALDADATPAAVVVGVGSGALVALRLAVTAPDRVARLVMVTGARPVGTSTVRSLHRGVADALPVGALQRLRSDERGLLQTLDLVRPLDHARLAPAANVEALVPYGRRDLTNRRPSEQLARALPRGRALALDGLGAGWVWSSPERLAELVA